MQKTDFPIEILIGEDESTDGTREICLDYAERYPDQLRVSLRSRQDVVNIDGRPRGSYNFRMTLHEARGEFIALCEGDDYWTDPKKLQIQVDYLRSNPDCVGCFHDTKLVDAEGETLLESYFQSDQEKFTQQDVLKSLLSREPTCSLMFRKSAFTEPLPEWFLRRPSDLYLDIQLTNHGSLGFVRRNMGAYRKHAGGIWSRKREAPQIVELISRFQLLLADPFFLDRYRELLLAKIDEFQAALFTKADHQEETLRLEAIVEEHTVTLTRAAEAAADGQKHIEDLIAQLDQLAATTKEQDKYIAVLEKERDRLTMEVKSSNKEATRAAADGQKHIDALIAQLDQLAATSKEQDKHIAVLEKERDRLALQVGTLSQDNSHYLKVIYEQNAYIEALTAQQKVIEPER